MNKIKCITFDKKAQDNLPKWVKDKMKSDRKNAENSIEKPFVTSRFGNNWKEHAKEHYDIDAIINIAWENGRKVILLEQEVVKLFSYKLPSEQKMVIEREKRCTYTSDDDRYIKDIGKMKGFEECYYWLENLTSNAVNRSVWMVQDKKRLIVSGMFSTKHKAEKYINGNEKYAIKELSVI